MNRRYLIPALSAAIAVSSTYAGESRKVVDDILQAFKQQRITAREEPTQTYVLGGGYELHCGLQVEFQDPERPADVPQDITIRMPEVMPEQRCRLSGQNTSAVVDFESDTFENDLKIIRRSEPFGQAEETSYIQNGRFRRPVKRQFKWLHNQK